MFSFNLTELSVLNKEHREAYEQTIIWWFFFVCNDFLKGAQYYYQSSEFLLCYYCGYFLFPLIHSIGKEKALW